MVIFYPLPSCCVCRYVWSGLLVLVGVLLNIYSKNAVDKCLRLAVLRLYFLVRRKKVYTANQFWV